MSANHTPGLMETDEATHDAPCQNICLEIDNRTVATVWIDDAPACDFNAEQTANARRLVACWNRLGCFSTEQIEDLGYDLAGTGALHQEIESLKAEVAEQCRLNSMGAEREARLRAQRDELLAALTRANGLLAELTFSTWIKRDEPVGADMHQRIAHAHEAAAAAIKTVKGGA